ncbi:unnamed protein product [Parascedosporium putredinis]|uniref:Uncharacterized protein n=1 Tax=Parascedosporium putredinis TaxID=1442378 RepID=A0A9P1H721_9PEZI|nr:unnamed protein product [Parascedosporium putredinis]CAI7999269.1 unnamed protein product [Parascedosporium putredinis]
MAKFPVTFGKRKSATSNADPDGQVSSFRVLERTEVAGVKSFDGGSGLGRPIATTVRPYSQVNMVADEDNMFANLQINRASGSSNTTKTASTDTSSRHSAVSTTPSSATPSADPNHAQILDDARIARKPLAADSAPLQASKSGSGFLNRAGRTFSFGSKKTLPLVPGDTPPPTATPPKLDEDEFNLDLGGDFGKMFNGFDKRASVATIRNGPPQSLQPLQPRSLTDNRPSPSAQPNSMRPPPSPHSVNSDHSSDGLLLSSNAERPSLFSRHTGTPVQKLNRPADIIEDENAMLLKESLAASKFLTAPGARATQTSRARQDDERINSPAWKADHGGNEDNLFDNNLLHSTRVAHRYVSRPPSPPRNRVMTPAQFEQYKQEKERTSGTKANVEGEAKDDEDEENYEDDEDDIERSRQAAKQRKKQEAHMTVYRQQMMKVTGESANPLPRPPLATSATAPVLVTASDGSDEDEEIPLAILAAHGFPNKNRPPARLNNAASNPNIRSSMMAGGGQPSRPLADNGSASSGVTAGRSSQLPAFARNLPQDPFVGAGLVRNATRESMAFAGGAPAPASQSTLPPGGLVGVIANEERSRALRRGSPNVDSKLINGVNGPPVGFDPITAQPRGSNQSVMRPQFAFKEMAMPRQSRLLNEAISAYLDDIAQCRKHHMMRCVEFQPCRGL